MQQFLESIVMVKRSPREFYILNDNSIIYESGADLIAKRYELFTKVGFERLRGADLVFACIAYKAYAFASGLISML